MLHFSPPTLLNFFLNHTAALHYPHPPPSPPPTPAQLLPQLLHFLLILAKSQNQRREQNNNEMALWEKPLIRVMGENDREGVR